ncbi:MAG: alpha/beta hydrolase [Microbacterium sp.]|uniref:alpha/beta hydrolase n=1 Tax=Microbacterium sp. TaxID=51671 RepID=UPI003A89892C
MSDWAPDILGAGFAQRTLPLGEDAEGPIVATIVRHQPRRHFWPLPLHDVDVLYVHGWSDYFFNRRFAKLWTDRGARFYALDLRKYGRSLRDGQTPGFITDLTEYDADIAAALEAMDAGGTRRLVLVGHSMGGLILSLWAHRHPRAADAVVLNSPWLEFQLTGATRAAISPMLELHSRLRPHDAWPQADLGFYARAQAEAADPADPIEAVAEWRPARTMTVHVGWMHAIVAGHAQIAAGLSIDEPICVLLSAHTAIPTRWSDALTRADTVLVVDDIAKASLKLGSSVTVERIDGALHDVFLSRHDAREAAYARLGRWVDAMIAR